MNTSKVAFSCYVKNPAQITLGRQVRVHGNTTLDASSTGRIVLGDKVTLNRYAYINASRGGVARSGPGNLNKPISGESATFDGPTGQESGAEDGKKNETDILSSVQGQSGAGSDGGRQDAGRSGAYASH